MKDNTATTETEASLVLRPFNPEKPCEVQINTDVLAARRRELVACAQNYLWNPANEESSDKGVFAVGMECGQYGLDLAEVLAFGKSIGCQVIQPSANHVNLAKAAMDAEYRHKVWRAFEAVGMPLTSVSIHCDTYAALAILDNPRAGMFTPVDIAAEKVCPESTSKVHLNRLALTIIGAAQFGIPALHLFWGMPEDLKPYGWPPQNPEQVRIMREKFVALVGPLVKLAERLDVKLCHEIHFGTIAMAADDLIEVWQMLGKSPNFCVGFDPSHFWHGETWLNAMDKLRAAGMKVVLAHAKNTVVRSGRPMLSLEMDDRLRGMAFTSLDDTAGIVSMWEYLGALTLSGLVDFWFGLGLPAPVHVEAENPFFRINEVTAKGVKYLLGITTAGLQLPQGHFTDAMSRKKVAPAADDQVELSLKSVAAEAPPAAADTTVVAAPAADTAAILAEPTEPQGPWNAPEPPPAA